MVADKPEQDTLSKLYAEWVSAAVKLSLAGFSATAKMMEAGAQAAFAAKQKTTRSPAPAVSLETVTQIAKANPAATPAKPAPKLKTVDRGRSPVKSSSVKLPSAGPVSATAAQSKTVAATEDLKSLSGIGPKLEQMLHARGVTSLSQIAKWTNAEVTEFDNALGLSGRISRDDWVGQARQLISNRTGS